MTAISDSSPLILFARIGRLDLLEAVFSEIFVPQAVWNEVVVSGHHRSDVAIIARAPWLIRKAIVDVASVAALRSMLGAGESESIVLWNEMGISGSILIDDRGARRMALLQGIPVIGSGGTLLLAKERGLIGTVESLLNDLRSAGLYLGDDVAHELLVAAGERS